jgi:UDP-GlcNAc3NAcA epimerase
MIKVFTVIGARPQIIKASAMSRAIADNFSDSITEILVHTGQHYDENMSQVFFNEMGIPAPDYNLAVGSGQHGAQTAKMIVGLEELMLKEKPDYINLYGDTNSTLAGAIAASKLNVPIMHIEAGLRSFNRKMPEEINRVTCDHLSTLLFSPTQTGYLNLIKEGFDAQAKPVFTPDNPGIFHCGDVMFDNSFYFGDRAAAKSTILDNHQLTKTTDVLATLHRDSNTDVPNRLQSIMEAFLHIAEHAEVVLPLHPRTLKKLHDDVHHKLYERVKKTAQLKIIDPVSFFDMIQLEQNAKMVITDSGGVQKEAFFFRKPCIIMRPQTEWVEIVQSGAAKLADADGEKIVSYYHQWANQREMEFPSIFGDGKAARFICETLIENT